MAGAYDIRRAPETKAETDAFSIITVPANALPHQLPAFKMLVFLTKGKETDWLKPSSNLMIILEILELYPADKMITYPVCRDINLSGQQSVNILNPVGDKLYTELK